MAKQIKNNKDFLIIQMSKVEYLSIIDSMGECNICGDYDIYTVFYYIAVLEQVYCETCYKAWLSGATRYKVDIPTEEKNFNLIKNKLKAMGVWND